MYNGLFGMNRRTRDFPVVLLTVSLPERIEGRGGGVSVMRGKSVDRQIANSTEQTGNPEVL